MTVEVVLLTVTTLVALVAVAAALIAVKTLRQVRAEHSAQTAIDTVPEAKSEPEITPEPVATVPRPVKVIEGRVVATLTDEDLLEARMSRPLARASVYVHGIAHALRPESRDRITALMRREYRRRRSVRLKVARRALRAVPGDALQQQRTVDWLGSAERQQLPRAASDEPVFRRVVGE